MSEKIIHFYFFRHGETDWNRQNKFQGHSDIPLNSTGIQQAQELPALLAPLGLTHLITSDLWRAHATAEIVSQELGITLQSDARLREANLGQAQGLTTDEIRSRFGTPLLEGWRSHETTAAHLRYPDGESGHEVLSRVSAAIQDLMQLPSESHVGVCTHGGVIRRLLQAVHPEPATHHPIPNTVVYAFRSAPKSQWGIEFVSRLR